MGEALPQVPASACRQPSPLGLPPAGSLPPFYPWLCPLCPFPCRLGLDSPQGRRTQPGRHRATAVSPSDNWEEGHRPVSPSRGDTARFGAAHEDPSQPGCQPIHLPGCAHCVSCRPTGPAHWSCCHALGGPGTLRRPLSEGLLAGMRGCTLPGHGSRAAEPAFTSMTVTSVFLSSSISLCSECRACSGCG